MSKKPVSKKALQIPLSNRTNTCAVQFKNDWPGLFIRGDHAISLSFFIRHLQKQYTTESDPITVRALRMLGEIADTIEQDVKV